MLTPSQIKQLAELVNEANIDVKNIDAVNEYIGLLLEDIAGFESINDIELAKIQVDVLSALKNR
jgi:phosphoglucomutase